jgi:hypothetical protein
MTPRERLREHFYEWREGWLSERDFRQALRDYAAVRPQSKDLEPGKDCDANR